MIKFFRHIRKSLVEQNQMGKYLKYAIGEILLVVIGILIALQINTWNEQQKTKEKELKYLSLIKQEMEGNLQSIQFEQKVLDDFLVGIKQLLKWYAEPDPTLTNKQLSKILVPILSKDMDFYFKNGTLNEIIATGNLKDITNDSIRNILASISGNLERVRAQEKTLNDYIAKGNNYLEKKGSIKQIVVDAGRNQRYEIPADSKEISNLFLLQSDEFENIMVYAALTGGSLDRENYATFHKELQTLIALIDQELQQTNWYMDTETIIYVAAAALILRVVIKVILRYAKEQKEEESE